MLQKLKLTKNYVIQKRDFVKKKNEYIKYLLLNIAYKIVQSVTELFIILLKKVYKNNENINGEKKNNNNNIKTIAVFQLENFVKRNAR